MLKNVNQVLNNFLWLFSIYLFIYFNIAPDNGNEPAPVQRRLAPVDDARPRAAQIRRRRQFNPAHGYDGRAPDNDDDDAGKQSII